MNLRGMLSGVRIRARDPRPQQPTDRTLLRLLSGHVQNLLIEANIRGRYWAVDELEITVNPNVTEYPIGDENFGKPFEVLATYSDGRPSHTVDFFEYGDMNFERSWPSYNATDPLWNIPYGDQRMAFYRKQGSLYARILQGTPAARYRILYQIGKFGDTTPLDEEIMLPEFYQLVEIRTAISALPHCEWDDNEALNTTRRKELAMALIADEQRVYPLFKSYVATQTAANMPTYRIVDSIDGY